MIDIRATEIRRRVAAGLSIQYLTPLSVCAHIRDHALYQHSPTCD
jgi:nicotinic acid mononucleotide adenylyltransferase